MGQWRSLGSPQPAAHGPNLKCRPHDSERRVVRFPASRGVGSAQGLKRILGFARVTEGLVVSRVAYPHTEAFYRAHEPRHHFPPVAGL
jgi:hypothetical protein